MEANRTPACGNCAAWLQINGEQGECHLTPPQVVFMGFQQPKLAGQQPQPLIAGVFPAVGAKSLCKQHQPAPLPVPMHPVLGDALVTVPMPADHTATHLPERNPHGTGWHCGRCNIGESAFASTPCNGANDA